MTLSTARVFVFAVAALLVLGCGQKPVVWQVVIDNGGDETASAIATDGNYFYVAGTASPTGKTDRAAWLITRLTRDGREVWRRSYNQAARNVCEDITADSKGYAYAIGRSNPQDKQICLVVKYAPDGNVSWQKGLALGGKTLGMGICQVSGDRIAVCGMAGTDANADHMIVLLDGKTGQTIWARNHDICCADLSVRIAADAKDNLAVIGQHGTADSVDIIVMKLNPRGETLWTRIYDSGGRDEAGDIAFDPVGNIVATGTAVIGDSVRCVILEYDPDGGVIRKAAYGQNAQAEGKGLYISPSGDIFVTGGLKGKTQNQVLVFQYQPSAISVWERQFWSGSGARGVDLLVPGDAIVAATVEGKTSDMAVYRLARVTAPKPPAARP